MEKKLKRRQGVEGKKRSWREDKELKSKEEDQEKRAPSQEDESVRPHDLEFILPTSQTKPKISPKLFLLSVWNFLTI
jgi:hypothetical protein